MRSNLLLLALQLGGGLATAQTTFIRQYGGDQSDIGFCVEQTADGGFIMCGGSEVDETTSMDMYLVKADAAGNEQWSRTFGTSMIEFAYAVVQTSDGGFVVCGGWSGFGADTLALVKVNSSGEDQWARRYPVNVDRSIGYSVIEADNGDLLCSGFAGPYGEQDAAIIRVGADGEPVWTTLVDLGANNAGTAVRNTADGGSVALVTSFVFNGVDGDLGLVRLNASGDTLWTRRFSTPETEDGHGLALDQNGDILIAGRYGTVPGDVLLMRTDESGNILWSHTYGSVDSHDEALDVEVLAGGDILLTGRSEQGADGATGMLLMRCDADGAVLWQHTYEVGIFAASQSCCVTNDGGSAMLGYTVLGTDSTSDFVLVKTDASGFTGSGVEGGPISQRISMFPVPADGSIRLTIADAGSRLYTFDLIDARGRHLMQRKGLIGTTEISCSELAAGFYTAMIFDDDGPVGGVKLQVVH